MKCSSASKSFIQTWTNFRNLWVQEMRSLWGLGLGNAICLPSCLSVGDRPGLSEIVFPYIPRILTQTSLASAACSITACKAILQSISFVSLHFQKTDSKKWVIKHVEIMWEGKWNNWWPSNFCRLEAVIRKKQLKPVHVDLTSALPTCQG